MSDQPEQMKNPEWYSNEVSVYEFMNAEEAPKYKQELVLLKMTDVVAIRNNTEEGKTTVDLLACDAEGRGYIICTSAKILRGIAHQCSKHDIQEEFKDDPRVN